MPILILLHTKIKVFNIFLQVVDEIRVIMRKQKSKFTNRFILANDLTDDISILVGFLELGHFLYLGLMLDPLVKEKISIFNFFLHRVF